MTQAGGGLTLVLVIMGLFVMVRMVMLMRRCCIRFMFVGMGGAVTVVGMVMVVLEGVGMAVMVVMPVVMFFFVMLVGMIVIMVVVMGVGVLMWVFALAHGFLLCR